MIYCYTKTKLIFDRHQGIKTTKKVKQYFDSSKQDKLGEDLLIKEEDSAIITVEGNPGLYVQWGLMFSKNHPILKRTIEFMYK